MLVMHRGEQPALPPIPKPACWRRASMRVAVLLSCTLSRLGLPDFGFLFVSEGLA